MKNLASPFRRATKADAPVLAELVNYAGEGMPLYLWSKMAGEDEDPWIIGCARAAREEGAFSYRNAILIEHEGNAAGCLIGYEIPVKPEAISVGMPAMFVPLQELENLVPATWYINVLGVQPQFRGLGLGARLIALAEETARTLGKRGTSLIVSDSNHGARRLYRRSGFSERAARTKVKDDWENEGRDWILLVKDF